MALAWENLHEVFVMFVVVVVFTSLESFTFPGYFSLPPVLHLNFSGRVKGLHWPWALPWLLSVALLLPGFSVTILPGALRIWVGVFYPASVFYLTLLYRHFWHVFVTQMRAGTPHPGSYVPALTELSPPAGAWTWTTHIVVTRPLIYQLRQWATKYKVKIQLLNMFHLLKVIWKNYENTLNKTWCTAWNCFDEHQSYFGKAAMRLIK